MTQKAIGLALGYPEANAQVHFAHWEAGTHPIPRKHIKTLAALLNIDRLTCYKKCPASCDNTLQSVSPKNSLQNPGAAALYHIVGAPAFYAVFCANNAALTA